MQTLKPDDARKLLFKELGIRGPSDDELKSGIKLVKQVDCLPLAIIAISHRIADTHEPLIRYSMKSYSANPKLESTYNQILDDLQRLGHMEAWNLMSLLAFFGQDVPVEMLHLGIKALQDVPVKSSEGSGKPDLNVTFSILMRHGKEEHFSVGFLADSLQRCSDGTSPIREHHQAVTVSLSQSQSTC